MAVLQGQRPNLLIRGTGEKGAGQRRYSMRKTSRTCTESKTARDKDLKPKLLDNILIYREIWTDISTTSPSCQLFNQDSREMHGYVGAWRECILQLRREMRAVSLRLCVCALKR